MSQMSSFKEGARVAVVGATGGIGEALLHLLEAEPRVAEVFAFAREPGAIQKTRAQVAPLDFDDEQSLVSAAALASAAGALDLVIVATGLLHNDAGIHPEKSMKDLEPAVLAQVLAINTIGPAMLAKHFLPVMARGSKTVFAALSARVGSIADNRLGGWPSYRASKAALNMLLKTFAIEHARRWPDGILAALHPGTVATDLSAPFAGRVPPAKLFAPETSARHLLAVINTLTAAQSGGFFAWDGAEITY